MSKRQAYPNAFREQLSAEQQEPRRSRCENRQRKLEREILSAAVWFARETGTIPTTSREHSDS